MPYLCLEQHRRDHRSLAFLQLGFLRIPLRIFATPVSLPLIYQHKQQLSSQGYWLP